MSLSSSAKLRSSGCSSPISASLERRLEVVKEARPNSLRFEETKEKIRKLFDRVELSVSAYDTAWVAMVPSSTSQSAPLFPQCINWLLDNQHCDGSWGLDHRHHSLMKDALSSTLACILALKKWGTGERHISKGLQFIESNSASVTDEMQHTPAGFDMIFPGMIEYARDLNLNIPLGPAVVDALIQKRDSALKSDYEGISKGRETYLAYVLEGMGNLQSRESILKYQRKNGSLFNSPAATAAALSQLRNDEGLSYLHSLLQKFKDAVPTVYPFDQCARLSMVDTLENLGVDRYFKNEIRRVMDETYRCWLQGDDEIYLDLTTCALAFRLLRAHGYDVSSDPIIPFAEESHFFDSLNGYIKDTVSVLQLFKAAQSYPDESVLEEQNSWTRQYLKMELLNWSITEYQVDIYLKQEVENVLKFPFYASLERLAHRRKLRDSYVDNTRVLKTSYRSHNICNPDFLKLAVDDFNFCQSIHREELELLKRWISEKRLHKLNFARQKLAYCYFSAAATLYSPELSDARISWAKNGVLTTVVDDFFDVGGSKEEMLNLIYLVERWDLNDNPLYYSEQVEIIFSALRDTILEIRDQAYAYQGRDVTNHIVEIWLALIKSMLREAEWSSNKSVPTVEDYVTNGYVSFALGPIVLPTVYLIGPMLSEDAIKSSEFNELYELMSTMGRLLNDIRSFERESKEGKLNAVSLHMMHGKDGRSQDEIIQSMKNSIKTKREQLLKLVLQVKGSVVPRDCKEVFWKMSKVLNLFYMNDDGFTSSDLLTAVNSVLYEPVSLPESKLDPVDL